MLPPYTSFDDYGDMQSKLQELNIAATSTEIHQIPITTKTLELSRFVKHFNSALTFLQSYQFRQYI